MNRLIDLAVDRQSQMRNGKYLYPDDDAFLVSRGLGARLMQLDLSIHHSTAKPRKLLKNDGTIVTQIVESVRRAAPQLAAENASFGNGTALSDAQVVPERKRHSGDRLDGSNRPLLEQQFPSMSLVEDPRAAPDSRDGSALLRP